MAARKCASAPNLALEYLRSYSNMPKSLILPSASELISILDEEGDPI